MTREAVIVAVARTAVGKAKRGTTRNVRSDDLAAAVVQDLLRQTDGKLDPHEIDDVIMGCALPEGAQGQNFARVIALRAGLPVEVPGMTINRVSVPVACSRLRWLPRRIIANGADVIIAGGAETMSLVPMTGFRFSPNPHLMHTMPEVYMAMGHTAERVADEWHISREAMDEFAYHSHQKAARAVDAGYFSDEIVPFEFEETVIGDDGLPNTCRIVFDQDEHLRRDTTPETLAKLKPVFREGGRVTAGNASPLSDGAAGVIVLEAGTAARLGLTPLVRFVGFNVAGVRPEVMGVGPVVAVPRLLKRTGIALADIDLVELNEAFAAQRWR